MNPAAWPALNASLNACSALFLLLGYRFIRRGQRERHRAAMLSALSASALFLASYLLYHALHGDTQFLGQGWIRPLYFFILISHVLLSVFILPFILIIVRHALAGRFELHKKKARWVFAIWLYVSLSGVSVFFMLKPYYP